MKLKSLLNLVMVLLVGQLLFSCSSAEYYRFASVKPESYTKAKAKPATPAEATVTEPTEEVAIAKPTETPALAEVEPTLEASAKAATPVLFEKKANRVVTTPAVAEKVNEAQPGLTITQSEALAMAKNRLATMTKAEKKDLKRELRDALEANRDATNFVEIILAILIPPLGVFLHEGEINNRFWISLLLTLLFFIPGVIYALLVVTDSI